MQSISDKNDYEESGYLADCDYENFLIKKSASDKSDNFNLNSSRKLTLILNAQNKLTEGKGKKPILSQKPDDELINNAYFHRKNIHRPNLTHNSNFNNNNHHNNKLDLFLTDSTLLAWNIDTSSCIDKTFDQVHGKSKTPYSNRYERFSIQNAKLKFCDSLLKKDFINNSEYLLTSYFEPIELENKISNFDEVSPFIYANNPKRNNKRQQKKRSTTKPSRHISINHFAAVEKKYGESSLKFPSLKKLNSTNSFVNQSNAINTNPEPSTENKLESNSALSMSLTNFDLVGNEQFRVLSTSVKVLARLAAKNDESLSSSVRKVKAGKWKVSEIKKEMKRDRRLSNKQNELKKTEAYMASIGEVPSLYPEKKLRNYRKKQSRSYLIKSKNEEESLCESTEQMTISDNNSYRERNKPLNFDKTKMSLKQQYAIDTDVANSFKYTQMMGDRAHKSSLNSIKLNFTDFKSSDYDIQTRSRPEKLPKISEKSTSMSLDI